MKAVRLTSITANSGAGKRLGTGFTELDRVLGGGIVEGEIVLVGGDPGVGKSTLLLQVAERLATSKRTVLYVSGEESGQQVRSRLDRIGGAPSELHFLGDARIESVREAVHELRPHLAIVDSLQTMRSTSGTAASRPSEMRDVMEALVEITKTSGSPMVVIGHVTKGGAVAGPKLLEHLVDAVLYVETAGGGSHRIVRATKNRFGGVAEVGVWQMTEKGLVEVVNPAAAFLAESRPATAGAIVAPYLSGTRVFLIEVQALVAKTRSRHPERRTTGYDHARLQLLVAVIGKYLGLPLAYRDIHVNVVGGLNAKEPALDLPVALAIASACENETMPRTLIAAGEIGLHGELRPITELGRRLSTAARLGFREAVIPEQAAAKLPSGFTLYKSATLVTAYRTAVGR